MHSGPQHLQVLLAEAGLRPDRVVPVAGGSAPAFRLEQSGQCRFVKLMPQAGRVAAEADGLAALAASPFRVPQVHLQSEALLVLEWLELASPAPRHEPAIAEALAGLHACTGERFGWHRDNWIGASPQHNCPADDWASFYRDQRLAPQLAMARASGLPSAAVDAVSRVMADIRHWIDYTPEPCLVHGDLWQGNYALCAGQPALFDPAVYHGDPLVDLAMLNLFGSPGRSFWSAYVATRAVDLARLRRLQPLYDLYHWLNHFTVFGEAYLMPLQRCCTALLQEQRG